MRRPPRVIVIGLDSMPPALAFEAHADRMPTLAAMRARGASGPLRSTDPPITVPAWVTMTTGADPGRLGLYGFRSRVPGTRDTRMVTSADVRADRIWDTASRAGLTSVVVSVPLTYPVTDRPRVAMTGCFLTPGHDSEWASAPGLKEELTARFGPYLVDVEGFRAGDKAAVLAGCRALTRQHFAIFRHLISTREPDFAMLVDLGPDRFHHAMLALAAPSHPRFDPSAPLAGEAADYYSLLDREIGETLGLAGSDTLVLVVSDHGVRPLLGSVCVNELLIREGLLVLEGVPAVPTPLSRCAVDWSRTRAWGEGGYHARISFNVAGREPGGIVSPDAFEEERARLASRIRGMAGPDGGPMDNRVFTPAELYGEAAGSPPDLTVYWDDLSLRSAGTVGHGTVFIPTNDTGPDDANHDPMGILVMAGGRARGEIHGARIADVHATVMDALGLSPPAAARGRSLR